MVGRKGFARGVIAETGRLGKGELRLFFGGGWGEVASQPAKRGGNFFALRACISI
ncbi:MAG: hypothetical protein MJE68_08915 [Proteobacteria bacterium]|nr:hypothetical protein [Pseudomonadota bacterium]